MNYLHIYLDLVFNNAINHSLLFHLLFYIHSPMCGTYTYSKNPTMMAVINKAVNQRPSLRALFILCLSAAATEGDGWIVVVGSVTRTSCISKCTISRCRCRCCCCCSSFIVVLVLLIYNLVLLINSHSYWKYTWKSKIKCKFIY